MGYVVQLAEVFEFRSKLRPVVTADLRGPAKLQENLRQGLYYCQSGQIVQSDAPRETAVAVDNDTVVLILELE
jgi:hypothetical protein